MVAKAIENQRQPISHSQRVEKTFVEKHFTQVAFAVSTLALFILTPLAFILGTLSALATHRYLGLSPQRKPSDPIIGTSNAIFAIVGATAAFLSFMPVGGMGGLLFRIIPFASSFSIGSTAYCALRL